MRPNTWIDALARLLALVGAALPNFWLALVLVFVFAVSVHWFPVLGWVTPSQSIGANLQHVVLPVVVLALPLIAVTSRVLRGEMLEVLHNLYIQVARAKGVPEVRVTFRHALRNALIPVVTVVGLQVGGLLGGGVITEEIFSLPGMGQLVVTSSAIIRRSRAPCCSWLWSYCWPIYASIWCTPSSTHASSTGDAPTRSSVPASHRQGSKGAIPVAVATQPQTNAPFDDGPRGARAWQKFRRNRLALVGLGLVLLLVLTAILAHLLAPYGADATNFSAALEGPSARHWLGTDDLGRDILSRILISSQESWASGLLVVLLALVVGVPLGLAAGYFGGWTDEIVMPSWTPGLHFPGSSWPWLSHGFWARP